MKQSALMINKLSLVLAILSASKKSAKISASLSVYIPISSISSHSSQQLIARVSSLHKKSTKVYKLPSTISEEIESQSLCRMRVHFSQMSRVYSCWWMNAIIVLSMEGQETKKEHAFSQAISIKADFWRRDLCLLMRI